MGIITLFCLFVCFLAVPHVQPMGSQFSDQGSNLHLSCNGSMSLPHWTSRELLGNRVWGNVYVPGPLSWTEPGEGSEGPGRRLVWDLMRPSSCLKLDWCHGNVSCLVGQWNLQGLDVLVLDFVLCSKANNFLLFVPYFFVFKTNANQGFFCGLSQMHCMPLWPRKSFEIS